MKHPYIAAKGRRPTHDVFLPHLAPHPVDGRHGRDLVEYIAIFNCYYCYNLLGNLAVRL